MTLYGMEAKADAQSHNIRQATLRHIAARISERLGTHTARAMTDGANRMPWACRDTTI